jgi:hypothetical protein
MADLTSIRNALAAQITAHTGLRCDGQARDQVTPPMAVILPGVPYLGYGATMDEELTINLIALIIISDAAPVEKTQRALDAYISLGPAETASVPGAILADPTLAGTVDWCEPASATNYGRISYAGQDYFGVRINMVLGASPYK